MNKIFWAGDSTVQTNDISTYPQTGIGQAFSLYVKEDITICNHAKNGRSTKSFMDEGRLEKIDQNIGQGDFLFIQFGHNDEKNQDPARYTIPGASFDDNLRTFINVARKHGAHPVLITPLERRCFDENGILGPGAHGDYVAAMKAVAEAEQVPLVDLYAMSRETMSKAGMEKTKEWFMNITPDTYASCPQGKQDNTHLQYAGAVTFAGLIAEGLKACGGIYAELLNDPNKKPEGLEDGDKA
ncbi:MAG: rhamnogalacturonan acetylesterase [Acetatifactor sp.]|nr:rhamnogalacturonan acetylesterase [Acetatifactor sp.]